MSDAVGHICLGLEINDEIFSSQNIMKINDMIRLGQGLLIKTPLSLSMEASGRHYMK